MSYEGEGQYEPQYEENFLQGEQEEVSVNIPGGEEYPECDDVGLTEDAIRIIQDFVLSNGHLRLTADQVAEVMRDVDGNEREESLYYARMVLDVWRMHNPHLEGLEDEYPREEAPEPVQREEYGEEQYEGVVQEVEVEAEVEVAAEPIYYREPEPEPAAQSLVDPGVIESEVSVKEPGDGFSAFHFKVPLPDEYPFYNEMVEFASRLLENFVVANGNLKIAHHDLGKSLLEPDGKLTAKAADLADMVLEVWCQQNPLLEVAPRTAAYDLASEEGQVVVTIPSEDEFPPADRFGILSNAVRIVRNFALQTGTLALTVDEARASMSEYTGDQWAETQTVLAAVLEAFRKRNPDLPAVVATPLAREVQPGVIQKDSPTPATISLPGGATLVIPLESDYSSFDRSGLTDDAIRIIREFVTDTGSLGITPELVAAQMVDFMGNASPDSFSIAASVLAVWRSRNPSLPLTSVKEIYPGVIEPEHRASASALQGASSASEAATGAEITSVVVVEQPPATAASEAKGQELAHSERGDSRDAAYEGELAKLLERLDCEVESFISPTFGAGVRIKSLSSRGTLFRSGVEPGDAIIAMDNLAITKVSQLYTMMSRVALGAKFTWRLRRTSMTGNVSEWCVTLSIPDRQKKAIQPRFAGLPAATPYQSHSGLLPNDPGFARRYAEVPDHLIQVPSHVPTQHSGGTRIIQGTEVIPLGVVSVPETRPAPPALIAPALVVQPALIPPVVTPAPVIITSPVRIAPDVDYASGTRTVYPLEGQPYTVPITTPYIASTLHASSTQYAASIPYAASVPYAASIPHATSTTAVQHSTPIRAVVHQAPITEVFSTTPMAQQVVAPSVLSNFSRTEIIRPSWEDIENIKLRMVRQYEAGINRSVAVAEERIPVSSFLRSSQVASVVPAVAGAPTFPYHQPSVVRRVVTPSCQPCSPATARSTFSYV